MEQSRERSSALPYTLVKKILKGNLWVPLDYGRQLYFFYSFVVFRDNCWIWVILTFSIICVCTTTFKVSMLPLNHCFQQSRVRMTLIKPLLCLNSIFPHLKAMLYQHMKFRFFHCFENLLIEWCVIYFISKYNCPVSWSYRIHWLHLCRGVRPSLTSVLDMTLNNLMVRFQQC